MGKAGQGARQGRTREGLGWAGQGRARVGREGLGWAGQGRTRVSRGGLGWAGKG